MMKICHLIFSFTTGGAETMLVDIVNEQVKVTSVCLVIINNHINETLLQKINSKVEIIRIGRNPKSRNPIPVLKLNWLLLSMKPDVIHCHNLKTIRILTFFFHKKMVVTIHDMASSHPILAKYKKVFSISHAVKNDILKKQRLDTDVVYNGIKTSAIKTKISNKDSNKFNIIQVARLNTKKKGQHLLIEAARKIVSENQSINIRVDFIGEGESFSHLNKLVQNCHLETQITFLGMKDRSYIYNHLHEYDLLVHPSLFEGFGLTVAEAMAAKVPVLVSDNDGPMEVIDGGRFGYHFKTGDTNDLADKIWQILLNLDTKSHSAMVEAAYQYVLTYFDVKITAENYLKAYEKI